MMYRLLAARRDNVRRAGEVLFDNFAGAQELKGRLEARGYVVLVTTKTDPDEAVEVMQ